jgi:hypothetical protein
MMRGCGTMQCRLGAFMARRARVGRWECHTAKNDHSPSASTMVGVR